MIEAENKPNGGKAAGDPPKVGTLVLFQPTYQMLPMHWDHQQCAIVTGVNDDGTVNLTAFLNGANFVIASGAVKEGTEDGTWQQMGVLSNTAKAFAAKKAAAAAPPPAHETKPSSSSTSTSTSTHSR